MKYILKNINFAEINNNFWIKNSFEVHNRHYLHHFIINYSEKIIKKSLINGLNFGVCYNLFAVLCSISNFNNSKKLKLIYYNSDIKLGDISRCTTYNNNILKNAFNMGLNCYISPLEIKLTHCANWQCYCDKLKRKKNQMIYKKLFFKYIYSCLK